MSCKSIIEHLERHIRYYNSIIKQNSLGNDSNSLLYMLIAYDEIVGYYNSIGKDKVDVYNFYNEYMINNYVNPKLFEIINTSLDHEDAVDKILEMFVPNDKNISYLDLNYYYLDMYRQCTKILEALHEGFIIDHKKN